ncbi:MAG TPA: hypothetical protein VL147_18875, partial [Devosia sp.]|nr:hypothetical protein [Devosia sp.]
AQAGAVAKASTATAASINLGAVMVILLGRPVEPFGAFRLAHGGGRLLTPSFRPFPAKTLCSTTSTTAHLHHLGALLVLSA